MLHRSWLELVLGIGHFDRNLGLVPGIVRSVHNPESVPGIVRSAHNSEIVPDTASSAPDFAPVLDRKRSGSGQFRIGSGKSHFAAGSVPAIPSAVSHMPVYRL